ncbi:Fc.00g023900.m01.CDS01 [Cosmosporella sp. VM-42]
MSFKTPTDTHRRSAPCYLPLHGKLDSTENLRSRRLTVRSVVHFHSATLSLPISPVISIAATILPIAGFLNAFIHPTLLKQAHASPSRIYQLTPVVLQTLQALITTILATLLFEGVVPSQGLDCVLENDWMGMYRAHDANGIRRIQDTLDCCGLNSVKDRAYPFPKSGASTCAETYGRSGSCKGPWRGAMQVTTGVDFGVVLAVGLMQIIGLLMMREGPSWWTAWRTRGERQVNGTYESRRPLLLPTSSRDEETAERQGTGGRNYGGVNGGSGVVNEEVESGPRVEPSTINERSAWEE